jgi:hypothetical protein
MMVRTYHPSDFNKFREIYEKFYKEEFDINEFNDKNFEFLIVITDEFDRIISCVGARKILELVAITDKDVSVRKRRDALVKGLLTISHFARRLGYNQIHAFIKDKEWAQHLLNHNFKPCSGDALYLDL